MSMENVKKFMELVQTEEGLAKRMAALKDGLQEGEFSFKNDKEFVEKEILPLAKEYDLEFSVEDFMEFTSSQLTSLSEEELAEVSGGFPGVALLTFLTLGIGAIMPSAAQKVANIVVGSPASTVQSVTEQDVDMSGTAGTEDIGNKIEFDERFKEIKKEFSKNIKEAFDGVKSYMSPEARSTWIESIARQQEQITQRENKHVNSRYNKANDRIEFTATWDNRLNDHMERRTYSQAALNGKLSNILKQQYDIVYDKNSAQLEQQYNTLNQRLQEKQKEKEGYKGKIKALTEENNQLKPTVDYCYSPLIAVCDALIQKNPYESQFKQWKTDLQNKTFSAWDQLKEKAAEYSITDNDKRYNCGGYVDWLLQAQRTISDNNHNIGIITVQMTKADSEINDIEWNMNDTAAQYNAHIKAKNDLNENMKTEFDYFYVELVKALKENAEISKLAKEATTTEAKFTLANKIKDKADQLVQEQFSKQLLYGCSLVVEQQGDSIGMKIVYGGYWFHQNGFSVDEFISKANHIEIINSESSKKRDEVAKKLAEYIQKQYTTITDDDELKRTIQSVLENLKNNGKLTIKENNKETTVDLGIKIENIGDKQVTFSSASGGEKRDTTLTLERIADEYNKMVNMQALETTRQKNEGTIEYTPFGRKLWNSIGSQAQHVLNTIAQIEKATGNLSDVKEREAFENDLKHVANQIAEESRGNVKKMYLSGEHRNDYSFNMKDLQKIKDFAAKIGQ